MFAVVKFVHTITKFELLYNSVTAHQEMKTLSAFPPTIGSHSLLNLQVYMHASYHNHREHPPQRTYPDAWRRCRRENGRAPALILTWPQFIHSSSYNLTYQIRVAVLLCSEQSASNRCNQLSQSAAARSENIESLQLCTAAQQSPPAA